MISYLNGAVTEKGLHQVVLDVGGVGYGVFMTAEDVNKLALKDKVKVHIYEYVREQAYDLYGFLDAKTKQLFVQLLDVNGVGPRMALNMLSIGPVDQVKQAIAEGEVKYLQQASGVGKRVAERVVVDLKDKIGLFASDDALGFLKDGAISDEAMQALVELGYSPGDAAKALQKVDKKLPTEERVRQALKGNS